MYTYIYIYPYDLVSHVCLISACASYSIYLMSTFVLYILVFYLMSTFVLYAP